MAINIAGGTSGVSQEVDAASKAGRTTLYGLDGVCLTPGPSGMYYQGFNSAISAAATPGAAATIFHIRNVTSNTKIVYIRKIRLSFFTVAAATAPQLVDLELIRTSGADTTGGTAVAVASIGRKDTSAVNPTISQFVYGTAMAALTVSGITFGQQLGTFHHASGAQARNEIVFDYDENEGPILLRAGEGLAIRTITAIGAAMTWNMKGNIQWDER